MRLGAEQIVTNLRQFGFLQSQGKSAAAAVAPRFISIVASYYPNSIGVRTRYQAELININHAPVTDLEVWDHGKRQEGHLQEGLRQRGAERLRSGTQPHESSAYRFETLVAHEPGNGQC
jgi:hypothetical protein